MALAKQYAVLRLADLFVEVEEGDDEGVDEFLRQEAW